MNPRLRRLLQRPDAWLEAAAGGYAVRSRADRRARVLTVLSEADFLALVREPGLRVRPAGGWTLRREPPPTPTAPPGRPGLIEGERLLVDPDGRLRARRANRTCSPITWLAARRDASGAAFLTPAQVAAAERLALDAEIALRGPSLTMRWDALPRARGGSAARVEPGDRSVAAARRLEAALAACGPARAMVDQVCIRASAMQAAEQGLGLRRREGKTLLRQGLTALAAHYRIG